MQIKLPAWVQLTIILLVLEALFDFLGLLRSPVSASIHVSRGFLSVRSFVGRFQFSSYSWSKHDWDSLRRLVALKKTLRRYRSWRRLYNEKINGSGSSPVYRGSSAKAELAVLKTRLLVGGYFLNNIDLRLWYGFEYKWKHRFYPNYRYGPRQIDLKICLWERPWRTTRLLSVNRMLKHSRLRLRLDLTYIWRCLIVHQNMRRSSFFMCWSRSRLASVAGNI